MLSQRRSRLTGTRSRSMFFFNDTATPEIYPLSLHDALPILPDAADEAERGAVLRGPVRAVGTLGDVGHAVPQRGRGVRGEQVGRQHGKIDVTVGGDPRVTHVASLGDGPYA